jgi:pimeloyl-ACP methyl ester carboxylesterase
MIFETARRFGREGTLFGVVTEPASAPAGQPRCAALLPNAGVVHRVGPNRIYVAAARRLAACGFTVVRFDLSGLGDSPARRDALPFDQASQDEVRQVMDDLERDGITTFVIAGLCSAAVIAFRAAVADERVLGAVLINPQGFDHSTAWNTYVTNRALARQYWRHKLFRPESWRRAVSGRSDYRRLFEVLGGQFAAMFRRSKTVSQVAGNLAADFERLHRRQVRLLVACSEGDFGVDYLNVILGADYRRLESGCRTTITLPAGDHSLTMAVSQEKFFYALQQWARTFMAQRTASSVNAPIAVAVEPPALAAAARGLLS